MHLTICSQLLVAVKTLCHFRSIMFGVPCFRNAQIQWHFDINLAILMRRNSMIHLTAGVNVRELLECESTEHLQTVCNMLEFCKNFSFSAEFVLPVYSDIVLKQIEQDTRAQSKCQS